MNGVNLSVPIKTFALTLTLLVIHVGHAHEPQPADSGLTEKDIAQMELRLFNELQVRMHMGKGGPGWDRRYKLLKSMENRGYKLAELTLRLFPFLGQADKFDNEAYEELRQLADTNGAGAECLFAEAITYWSRKKEPQVQKDKQGRAHYVQSAADKDQARCVAWVAGWYIGGRGPKEVDALVGKKMFLKAAMLGYQQAQLSLAYSYLNGRRGYSKDYIKAYCWFEVAGQAGTGAIRRYKVNIYGLTKKLEDNPPEFYFDPSTFCQQPISNKYSPHAQLLYVENRT